LTLGQVEFVLFVFGPPVPTVPAASSTPMVADTPDHVLAAPVA
jgi:hypothetical protein